jgi:putative hydrolase of the HAD superfamily
VSVRAVTFDCAQTLVAVDWRPAVLAVECAHEVGLIFDHIAAAEAYDRLLRARWPAFRELNLTRDEKVVDAFWRRLTLDWSEACGLPTVKVADIVAVSEERLFGSASTVFTLFDDVVPCLERLKKAGLRLGVVSNWDISLHKTLRAFGLSPYFDVVVASMEEGVEKPDPRIFAIALERMGVDPSETVHVGDNPLDDLSGARGAGIKGYVIDRANPMTANVYLSTLLDLPERLGL